jgi:hypothetical protein
VSEKRLQFGASPLYFGLRAFKALLHIAYKLESEEPLRTKQLLQKEQLLSKVQSAELVLKVDCRRDGNVVKAEKTAAICGVPTILMSNLDVIWNTLALSQPINSEKFGG